MNKYWRAIAGFGIGFLAGAGAGLAWSSGAKSRLSKAVTTRYHDGRVTTEVDVAKVAAGGFADMLR